MTICGVAELKIWLKRFQNLFECKIAMLFCFLSCQRDLNLRWTEKDEEIDPAIICTTYNLLHLAPELIWCQNGFAETVYLLCVRQEVLAERKGFQKRLASIEAESLKLMTVTELQHFEEKKRREKISTREKHCEDNAMKIQHESNKMDSILDDIKRSFIQMRAGIQ